MPIQKFFNEATQQWEAIDAGAINDGVNKFTPTDIKKISDNLKEQESQTQTLTHGLNVLSSDQASPLKVEFYGDTKVNLLGKTEKVFRLVNGEVSIDSNLKISGKDSYKIQGNNGASIVLDANQSVKTGSFYIFIFEAVVSTGNYVRFRINSGGYNVVDKNGLYYSVVSPTTDNLNIVFYEHNTEPVNVGAFRLYEIPQSTYDKIGVSLQDSQVAEMFPYVDSVQHVKNPVVKVSGKNLFNKNDVIVGKGLITSTNGSEYTDPNWTISNYIEVVPSQKYYVSNAKINSSNFGVVFYDKDKKIIGFSSYTTSSYGNLSGLGSDFTLMNIPTNTKYTRFSIHISMSLDGVQFELGEIKTPVVEFNNSYLYAETTLAGNTNKKDILYRNEGLNRWEKIKNWETDVVLDGSLTWAYSVDSTGYKKVKAPLSNLIQNSLNMVGVKYDGKIITSKPSYGETGIDEIYADTVYVSLGVSDIDSGWKESQIPTADMIKAYFNGYKYTGDGTTHSWVSIVDGTTTPTEQTATFCANPANKPTGYKNYFLSYQLSKSVIEPVQVEGDLSISGDAQVEVGEGVIVREEVEPLFSNVGGSQYFLNLKNNTYFNVDNPFNFRLEKFISIYKNGIEDIKNWSIGTSSTAYGKYYATIAESKFDSTAEYTVVYIAESTSIGTTNIQEVKATYQNSIKSSFQQVVAKQSDIATDVSVIKRNNYDMLVRLIKLEQEGE